MHIMNKVEKFNTKDSKSLLISDEMGIPEPYNDDYIPEEIYGLKEHMAGDISLDEPKLLQKNNFSIVQQKDVSQRKEFSHNSTKKTKKAKETPSKSRYGIINKSAFQSGHCKTLSAKKKPLPVAVMNPSAEVVLLERKVQIKDLESQVVYLQGQIKELKIENKTLCDMQSRQSKELRKFKEGIADIPSLLKSHKEETKMLQKTIETMRKENKDYKQDLKVKHEIILKKDNQIEKQTLTIKQLEKDLQNLSNEVKKLKMSKKAIEEENENVLNSNKVLKSKNEELLSKIQEMTCLMSKLENDLTSEKNMCKLITSERNDLREKIGSMKEVQQSSKADLHNENLLLDSYDSNCHFVYEKENFDEMRNSERLKDSVPECVIVPNHIHGILQNEQKYSETSLSKPEASNEKFSAIDEWKQHPKIFQDINSKKEFSKGCATDLFPAEPECSSEGKAFFNAKAEKVQGKGTELFRRTKATKEALIHTLNIYDNVCKRKDSAIYSDVNFDIPNADKLLPPLRQISRRCRNVHSSLNSDLHDINLDSYLFNDSSSSTFPIYSDAKAYENSNTLKWNSQDFFRNSNK